MEQQATIQQAVKKVAWGYVLLHLSFNFNTIDVLPDWLAYILFLRSLPVLQETERTFSLLRPLAVLLALWQGFLWTLSCFGLQLDLQIMSLAASVVSLYFHFQLITDLALLAHRYHCMEERKLLHLRTVRTILYTILTLPFPWKQSVQLSIVLVVILLILTFWICSVLFSLSRSLAASCEESG